MSNPSQAPVRVDPGRLRSGWLEALLMAAALGAAAWLAAPLSTEAAHAERSATLRDDLHFLRTQILVYRAQHGGMNPGYPQGDAAATPTHEAFMAQMSHYSNAAGETSATPSAQYPLGPYLQRVPVNTVNGHDRVALVAQATFPDEPVPDAGWLYHPATGRVAPNLPGRDAQGRRYWDY